jgi:uncharacterized protein YcfJ
MKRKKENEINKYIKGKCGSLVLRHSKTALGSDVSYQVQDREIKETTYMK